MSCFGRVVLLPNGEVAAATKTAATATAAAAAAATTAATVQTQKATPTKAKEKTEAKEKTDTKTRLKRKVTCELKGGNVKQRKRKIRCSYYCPGDPPTDYHDILLDLAECPRFWDFYL